MDFPSHFRQRIQGQLPKEADLLFKALEEASPVSIRLNPLKPFTGLPTLPSIPWNEQGRYLYERPSFTLDPAFHAGMYYVQEASSMSLEFVLNQLDLTNALVLDLCGAPGGKSSLLANHLWDKGGMVLANEVIRSRALILKENLIKWGLPNIATTNLDPARLAASGVLFDLIVVDAPCSGEGMFRKDESAKEEWSPEHVELCASRQKRILSDILPALKPGGYLIYSTCTFSETENEANLSWLAKQEDLESVAIPFPESWNINTHSNENISASRFYPHKIKGEGFFISLMQKKGTPPVKNKTSPSLPGKKNKAPIEYMLKPKSFIFQWFDGWYALPENLKEMAGELFHSLPIQYMGTKVAEAAGNEWKPSAELAFSVIANPDAFAFKELSRLEALHFLHRDDLKFPEFDLGWIRLNYLGQGLGFVKNLGKRSNSQYPKEWRIRKDLPEELPSQWHL